MMRFEIEYEETVKRTNTIVVEVESEGHGEALADELYNLASGWDHPDDIKEKLRERGVKVLGMCRGAETAEYEIV